VEAGIDPDFNQMTEIDRQLFIEDCWDEFLSEIGPEYQRYIGPFLRIGGSIGRLKEIADKFYDSRFERYVSRFGKGEEREEDRMGGTAGGTFHELFLDFTAKLSAMAGNHCIDSSDKGKQKIQELIKHREIASSLGPESGEEYLLGIKIPKGGGAKKKWKPEDKSDEQKELRKELARLQKKYRCIHVDRLRDGLEMMFEDYLVFIDKRKRAEGSIDFDDLLIRMRELLNNRAVVEMLRDRYRYILVDEFQDTNSIQAEIVFILAGLMGEGNGGGRDDSSLFIVGDPKQSIYRFRKADVEVYEGVREDFSREDSYLKITQNFRSGKGVLNWINKVFSSLIRKPESGRFQPDYEPVSPFREDGDTEVLFLNMDKGEEKPKVDELREKEGIATANAIRYLIDSKRLVRDVDSKIFRPVRFSDIAMLYRSTTGLDYYETSLKNAGIPYVVCGGGSFYARQEVRDLANAVWVIENHWDPVYLTAVLRSVIFGFSDEEIFLFRNAGGKLDYLSGEIPEGENFSPFREAYSLLSELHLNRNSRGVAGTISELIRRTGYREVSVFRSHSEQKVGNIEKVIRMGREFDRGFHSFRQFAIWFKDQDRLGTKEQESSLLDEDENAVRLLTIHKSKGLQFPVVFMINLQQGIVHRKSIFIRGGRKSEFRVKGEWHTTGYKQAKSMDRERFEAEIMRLLYVSATRAGDILVITDVRNQANGSSYFGLIEDFLPPADSHPGEELAEISPARSGEENSCAAQARKCVSTLDLSGRTFVKGEGIYAKPPPAGSIYRSEGEKEKIRWMEKRRKLVESRTAAEAVITPSSGKEEPSSGGIGGGATPEYGASFGTAFHRLMEIVDFGDTERLNETADMIAGEQGLEGAGEELAILARKALSSHTIRGLSGAEKILREVPFTVPLDTGDRVDEPSYLSGKVDLLFQKGGAWTAVDYKTDDIDDPGARFSDYRPQAVLYLAGLKKLGIQLRGGIVFYFVRPDMAITLFPEDIVRSELPSGLSLMD